MRVQIPSRVLMSKTRYRILKHYLHNGRVERWGVFDSKLGRFVLEGFSTKAMVLVEFNNRYADRTLPEE
jgi:hypothetical protein